MAGDMCVCALLYEQNKVLLEEREKELEGCRRSQNEVGSMETYRLVRHLLHVHVHVDIQGVSLSPARASVYLQ